MKRLFYLAILISWSMTSNAQKYLRYTMKDGEFNGFYTEMVETMTHLEEAGSHKSIIYTKDGLEYSIPVDNIEKIEIENAIPQVDDVGGYRLYEFNFDGQRLKSAFADNRASLCASSSGEFGPNDTIVFASAYNGVELLIMNDSSGRIKKIFCEDYLLWFDYDLEEGANAILQTCNDYVVIPIEDAEYANEIKWLPRSGTLIGKIAKFLKNNKIIQDFFVKQRGKFGPLTELAISDCIGKFLNFLKVAAEVDKNPELRNQCIVVDALSITSDIMSIVAALYAEPVSPLVSTTIIAYQLNDLLKNLEDLYNQLYPDETQMQIYREYYKEKYGISLTTFPASEITHTCAMLNGTIVSLKEPTGQLFFSVETTATTVPASKHVITDGLWAFSASIDGLEPGCTYEYASVYRCIVDGLELMYYGEYESFTTKDITCSVTLSNFKVTDTKHKDGAFENDGKKYDYRFDVTLTATLQVDDISYIDDWGYVYEDPNGRKKGISLSQFGGKYTDSRYSYFRNDPHSSVCLYGYVVIAGVQDTIYFSPEYFPLDFYGPEAITGDFSDIGLFSATVSCSYNNVPDNGVCGVEYWASDDEDNKHRRTANTDGNTHTFTLNGLRSGVYYCYRAFVDVDGQYYYGNESGFYTDTPDISGSWSCKNFSGDGDIEEYTFVLSSDHTAILKGTDYEMHGGWSVLGDGYVNITVSYTSNSWDMYDGHLDNIANPSAIEGNVSRGQWTVYGNQIWYGIGEFQMKRE